MTTDKDFPAGKRRGPTATLTLAGSYAAVFGGMGSTPEAREMVMNDLAEFSGYFAVLPTGTGLAEFADANGRRAVFARILSLSGISELERERLREAALIEMQISNAEGER